MNRTFDINLAFSVYLLVSLVILSTDERFNENRLLMLLLIVSKQVNKDLNYLHMVV